MPTVILVNAAGSFMLHDCRDSTSHCHCRRLPLLCVAAVAHVTTRTLNPKPSFSATGEAHIVPKLVAAQLNLGRCEVRSAKQPYSTLELGP